MFSKILLPILLLLGAVATTAMLLYVLGKSDFNAALVANESFKEQIFKVIFQRQ